MYINKTNWYANQNMCYMCSFEVKDWHTNATCQKKKQGHQDGFTCTNYKIAMHKNLHPST